jgi:hypothetical protein
VKGRPKAVRSGVLPGTEIECHVLDDGRRVVSQRGVIAALRNGEPGTSDLARYIARLPKRFAHLAAIPNFEFSLTRGGVARGVEGAWLVDFLNAYVDAFMAGELKSSQAHLAVQAGALIRSFAKVGVEALIDEATGYQQYREDTYLGRRLNAFLREEAARWEMTWPASLAKELCKLYGWKFGTGPYPRQLASIFHKIYQIVLGEDVTAKLKELNPQPHHGSNHHQFLKPDAKLMLGDDIKTIQTIALDSNGVDDFWKRMLFHYRNAPFQMSLRGTAAE